MVEQSGRAQSARHADTAPAEHSTLGRGELVGPVEQLSRTLAVVRELIANVRADQWSAPTPCTEWSVQRLVSHLVGMNRVFVALLNVTPPPQPGAEHNNDDPGFDGSAFDSSAFDSSAFDSSAADLLAAFSRPGILEQKFLGPLGVATGADRLQIRLYDLLAHGWDLAQATGQPVGLLPDDVAEQSLTFVRGQLTEQARPGRFDPAQPIADDAPAIERLVAFLGRPVPE